MAARCTIENVSLEHRKSFQQDLLSRIGAVDWEIEGYQSPDTQRDLSIKYRWGHNHNFGSFALDGQMGDRHFNVLAEFIDGFGLPLDLSSARVLDIGVWTGGTSLILAAMGAEVVALEEVRKYADTVNYLADAFGLKNLRCQPLSLYSLEENDAFDYVIYSGVLYHVTDPVLSLRILFNALKDGGKIFVETFGVKSGEGMPPLALVEGPRIFRGGKLGDMNRGGWNYFVPSQDGLLVWLDTVGFEQIDVREINANNRIKASAVRQTHKDMIRAGLSRADVR